jgi:hypothetical protein
MDHRVKNILHPFLSPFSPGKIAMVHLGRSGSTVLANLLREHPRICWRAELYNPIFLNWEEMNNGMETVGEMPVDAVEYLRNDMKKALHRYYGFEIKPFHFRLINYEPEDYFKILDSLGFSHFVLLERKNRLRKIVSSLIAHENKMRYHVGSDVNLKVRKVRVDVDSIAIDFDRKPLLDFLEDYDNQVKRVEELLAGRNSLRIIYEEHIQSNPKIAYNMMCDFLHLKPGDPEVNLSRTNPFPVSQMIENYEEVGNVLSGTPYEWMLID